MKFFIFFLLVNISYTNDNNHFLDDYSQKWSGSFSFGICMERTLMSTQEFSFFRHLDEKSDAYITFGGFIIFTGNLGIGYRYYFNSRKKSSFFSGISINTGIAGGEMPEKMSSINLSFGRAIKSKKLMNSLSEIIPVLIDNYMILNLGVVLSYSDVFDSNHDWKLLPILNLELKL